MQVVATKLGINLEIIEAENNMMELFLPELSIFWKME